MDEKARQYAYVEAYSSVSPPPYRGYVLEGSLTQETVLRFPIAGVIVRTRRVYSRPASSSEAKRVLRGEYWDEAHLRDDGFRLEYTFPEILPILLHTGFGKNTSGGLVIWDPDPKDEAAIGRVVWCAGKVEDEESALAAAEQEVKERVREFRTKARSATASS